MGPIWVGIVQDCLDCNLRDVFTPTVVTLLLNYQGKWSLHGGEQWVAACRDATGVSLTAIHLVAGVFDLIILFCPDSFISFLSFKCKTSCSEKIKEPLYLDTSEVLEVLPTIIHYSSL